MGETAPLVSADATPASPELTNTPPLVGAMPASYVGDRQNQLLPNGNQKITESYSNEESSGVNDSNSDYVELSENLPTSPHSKMIDQKI